MRAEPTYIYQEQIFWGIGQGLFTTSQIKFIFEKDEQEPRSFNWVYDCGSTNHEVELKECVENYRNSVEYIHMVCISHFHEDHINGMTQLLLGKRIGSIVLPYLTVAERMLIAIDQGIDSTESLFQFISDPVSFLAELDCQIDQIVFVLPGSSPPSVAGEPSDPDGPPMLDPDQSADHLKLQFPQSSNPTQNGVEEDDPILSKSVNIGCKILFLKPGGRFTLGSVWEFIPYNDKADKISVSDALKGEVRDLFKRLIPLLPVRSTCGR